MLKYNSLFMLIISFMLFSCEKDIEIVLPDAKTKLVVEGNIEQGRPPFVMLTKTTPFFSPTDINSLQNSFVKNAIVTVSNGTTTVQLQEICTNQLPDSLLPAIAELIGVNLESLKTFGFCLYTTLNPAIFGEVGKSYTLSIQSGNEILTSITQIPSLVLPNKFWYKDQPGFTDFGYVWFELTDPPQIGNAYRAFTQRKGKDSRFIPVLGSVFDDQFINGLTFDGVFLRGKEINSTNPDDLGETADYFQQGDTIIIKFCTIDQRHYKFWDTFEIAAFNSGNPFSSPVTIQTNINGGLGVWGGYGVSYDTLIAVDL